MGECVAGGTGTWTNWAGNQTAKAQRVVTPQTPQEVAEVLRAAESDGLRVKGVGSGHSFTAAAKTDGVLIRPSGLTRVKAMDRETGLVTVESGMPLARLNELLAEQGLALTNMGDIQVQTVAGAISTGTHGTGRARLDRRPGRRAGAGAGLRRDAPLLRAGERRAVPGRPPRARRDRRTSPR